jgi:C4-type Zn-finger protein
MVYRSSERFTRRDPVVRRIDEIIEKAAKVQMSDEEKEAQRRSFAYGNAHIENERVTKEMIDRAASEPHR